MISLLVADDERWVRERLAHTIPWQAHGIHTVYAACDGEEALELIVQNAIDIAIVDIRMPGLTGLEVIQKVREKGLSTLFIIISGYADFTYAQQAIAYGVTNYMLKPVEADALVQRVEECQDILKTRQAHQQALKAADRLSANALQLQQSFWSAVVGGALPPQEITRRAALLGIPLTCARYGCLIVLAESETTITSLADAGRLSPLWAQLSGILEQAGDFMVHSFTANDSLFFILGTNLEEAALQPALAPALARLAGLTQQETNRFLVGTGRFRRGVGGIVTSAEEAHTALRFRFYRGPAAIYNIEDYNSAFYAPAYPLPQGSDVLAVHIKNGNSAKAHQALGQILQALPGALAPADLQMFSIHIVGEVSRHLMKDGVSPHMLSSIPIFYLNKIHGIVSLSSLHRLLGLLADSIMADFSASAESRNRKVVDGILQYIGKNYGQPLSSSSVAAEFYFNPSYFSKMFRDETGESFTRYLARLRVDIAKDLLKNSNRKISDIAREVGYYDMSYFLKVFRSYTGLSPSAWRAQS